jgi:hypothetical protein
MFCTEMRRFFQHVFLYLQCTYVAVQVHTVVSSILGEGGLTVRLARMSASPLPSPAPLYTSPAFSQYMYGYVPPSVTFRNISVTK